MKVVLIVKILWKLNIQSVPVKDFKLRTCDCYVNILLIRLFILCHWCGHKHSLPTLRAEASTTVRSTLNIGFTTHDHLSTVVEDLFKDWKRHVLSKQLSLIGLINSVLGS